MGHSVQVMGILVHAASSFFAVPPVIRIHEGLVWSNRDHCALLGKMLSRLDLAAMVNPAKSSPMPTNQPKDPSKARTR